VQAASKELTIARQTVTRGNGLFYFLDLPDGTYEVRAFLPGSGTRRGAAKKQVKVSRDDQGNIRMEFLDLPLTATSIRGTVNGPGKDRVMLAQVRLKGSGEQTFTDRDGRFFFSEVEAGNRTVQVVAQGYKPASKVVRVSSAGTEHHVDFVLARAKDVE
jgi:hypothetical protein